MSESNKQEFVIKSWLTGQVLYQGEHIDLKEAVEEAIKASVSLAYADLYMADLYMADLTEANLTRAKLTRAKLTEANLTEANLTEANLTEANLTGADLTGAKLTRAKLTEAKLTEARKTLVSDFEILRNEVPAFLAKLREGKIDGSRYEGDCACLRGTFANIRGCSVSNLPGIIADSSDPAERMFLALSPGHTPENHPIAKIVEDWTLEWMREQQEAKTEWKDVPGLILEAKADA